MAFFSAPDVPWLYSGVTNTKASNAAIFAAQRLVWSFEYLPMRRRHRLVEQRQLVVLDVDDLIRGIGPLAGNLVHPLGDRLRMAARPGAADDDGDLDHLDTLLIYRLPNA